VVDLPAVIRPMPVQSLHRRGPLVLLLILTLAAFAVGSLAPYRLDSDTAFQLESVRQWQLGATPSPGFLRLPDPADLSRDRLVWSTWWPLGFPFLYAPLPAAGLPFAAALRLTSLLLFLAGALGWLRLADRLDLPPWIRYLYAATLAGYALTIGGAASLRTADVLAWAAGPWLVALALRPSRLFLCGLALGATYWLRYSLFLISLPLLAWAAWRTAFSANGSSRTRIGRLAALGLGFALPVAVLFALNLHLSASLAESATGTRSAWSIEDAVSARPERLAVSLAGAPGLGLFQSDLWIHHLVYFSDSRLPFLRGLDPPGRLLLKSFLGIPATAALAWGLARGRQQRPGAQADLAALLPAGFYLALLALSIFIGYNYLANETRFAAGFLPLAQPLVLAGWLAPGGRGGRLARALGAALLVLFCAAPLLFATAIFLKNDVRGRVNAHCAPSDEGLYTPELSCRQLPAVEAAVAASLRSPRDLVVLAGPAGWGSSYLMWLEVPHRTLPVSTFVSPLGARYAEAAYLHSRRSLVASQPLRVVLVASRSLAADGSLATLQARFPQARAWRSVPVPPGAEVAVSFSDLEVR
jgi:hypothetical protein